MTLEPWQTADFSKNNESLLKVYLFPIMVSFHRVKDTDIALLFYLGSVASLTLVLLLAATLLLGRPLTIGNAAFWGMIAGLVITLPLPLVSDKLSGVCSLCSDGPGGLFLWFIHLFLGIPEGALIGVINAVAVAHILRLVLRVQTINNDRLAPPKIQNISVENSHSEIAPIEPRAVAYILDLVFQAIIFSSVLPLLLISKNFNIEAEPSAISQLSHLLDFKFLILGIIYWTGLTLIFGATPGKKIMRIRIVDSNSKSDLSFFRILIRETIGRYLTFASFGLGFVFVLFNKERRALHDLVSGTKVISNKRNP